MTIVFEDISIVISIVTVYLVFKNTFEDSHNYLNWCVILNVLGAFSALFISTFYQNSPGIISLNNYLILLSYLLFLILVFLTLFVHKQKQIEAKQKKKVIPLTQK